MSATNSSQRPRVQIPVGAKYHGLSIDGTFVNAIPEDEMGESEAFFHEYSWVRPYLPPEASHAYWNHYNTDNLGWVYQCTNCDYLSMSKKCRVSAYDKKQCTNCDSRSWKRVYPHESLLNVPKEKRQEAALDVLRVTSEDVPNHPSHLGRIQNQIKHHVTRQEMFERVADAVEAARREDTIDY